MRSDAVHKKYNVITVPGLFGSDESHWQTHWERRFGYSRTELGHWDNPEPEAWGRVLHECVEHSPLPVILAAHSLGSVLSVRYLECFSANVAGAFLVAPTDVEADHIPEAAKRFAPIPRTRLPVPTLVVATESDPYLPLAKSRELCRGWEASLNILESGGHLGRDAALGQWDAGHELLTAFVAGLSRR